MSTLEGATSVAASTSWFTLNRREAAEACPAGRLHTRGRNLRSRQRPTRQLGGANV